jgi:hypothetical protein
VDFGIARAMSGEGQTMTATSAVVGTAQLLPREVENRPIYTILAKPVRRVEFLLG